MQQALFFPSSPFSLDPGPVALPAVVEDCGVSDEQAKGTKGTQDSLACSPFPFWSFCYVLSSCRRYSLVQTGGQGLLWPSR